MCDALALGDLTVSIWTAHFCERCIAQAFATAHGMRYVEVSARTGENVTAMFDALNRVLVTKYECP